MPLSFTLPPGLILIVAGLILPVLPVRARQAVMLVAPVLALAAVWLVPDGPALSLPFLGYDLVPCDGNATSRLFGTAFAIMAFGGALYALGQTNVVELTAAFFYAGASLGVAFAGDLVTVFVFWELMAVASTLVVWSAGRQAAGAGLRYAAVHLLGGVLLMAGIAGHVAETGSIAFSAMHPDSIAHWLILAGFLVNTAAPPLSAWLPDAYPRASYSGTVFLSAFTTKTAVYVLLVGFPGAEVLIFVGLYMVFYGIFYGILENDIRRILSYSLVNQVGFMVTAIGIGTPLALNGAAAHAFTHIIYKALLLMSAGSVMTMTGRSKGSELGGLFRAMPVTAITGIIGGLSISAVPLTSGFVSKAMIAEGAAEAHMPVVWLLVSAAAVGVFIDIGLKWPWYIFFAKDAGLRPKDPPIAMRAGMTLFASPLHRNRCLPRNALRVVAVPGGLRPVHRLPCRHDAATVACRRTGLRACAAVPEAEARYYPRHRLVLAPGGGENCRDGLCVRRSRALRPGLSRAAQCRRAVAVRLPDVRASRRAGAELADRGHGGLGDAVAGRVSHPVLL